MLHSYFDMEITYFRNKSYHFSKFITETICNCRTKQAIPMKLFQQQRSFSLYLIEYKT